MTSEDGSPDLAAVDPRLPVLLKRMNQRLPSILEELETHGEKVGHWAWWVFPTEKEGFSEPAPKSAVSYTTAPLLLQHAPPEWKLVLEKVLELSDASQGGIRRVLPAIDHDRVRYFALFWKEVADTPDVNAQWVRDLALKFEAAF